METTLTKHGLIRSRGAIATMFTGQAITPDANVVHVQVTILPADRANGLQRKMVVAVGDNDASFHGARASVARIVEYIAMLLEHRPFGLVHGYKV